MERTAETRGVPLDVVAVVRPFLYAAAFGGLGLYMIVVVAGAHHGMWRPPPNEPIAGAFSGTAWEPIYIGCAYRFTGLAAVTSPFATEHRLIARITAGSLLVSGLLWLSSRSPSTTGTSGSSTSEATGRRGERLLVKLSLG